MEGNNKGKEKGLYNKQEHILDIYRQWIKIGSSLSIISCSFRLPMKQIKSYLK